eukprot:Polyplicarium_translucidae@DN5395_c0_g1_i1.p1
MLQFIESNNLPERASPFDGSEQLRSTASRSLPDLAKIAAKLEEGYAAVLAPMLVLSGEAALLALVDIWMQMVQRLSRAVDIAQQKPGPPSASAAVAPKVALLNCCRRFVDCISSTLEVEIMKAHEAVWLSATKICANHSRFDALLRLHFGDSRDPPRFRRLKCMWDASVHVERCAFVRLAPSYPGLPQSCPELHVHAMRHGVIRVP